MISKLQVISLTFIECVVNSFNLERFQQMIIARCNRYGQNVTESSLSLVVNCLVKVMELVDFF